MENPSQPSHLWRDLDRLAFCENAILLEICHMSQGKTITSRRYKETKCSRGGFDDRFTENFLDDIALLASGSGGKDNVAATSLERSTADSPAGLVVRIARNEGFEPEKCAALQEIIDQGESCCSALLAASGETQIEIEEEIGLVLPQYEHETAEHTVMLQRAVEMCQGRLMKHINAFVGELRHAQYPATHLCQLPAYSRNTKMVGSRRDIALHGEYCATNHTKYAKIMQSRIDIMRRLCSEVAENPDNDVSKLCQITQMAYSLRGYSKLLQQWLTQNIGVTSKPSAISHMSENILKRIGKLSRIFRAVLTVAKFKVTIAQTDTEIRVMGLDSQKLQVPELRSRTFNDLKVRGGRMLSRRGEVWPSRLLGRWSKYRTHAEIQLLLFYEQNADIPLATNYIGGDKLCCYLCYQFITMHNRFEVNGCHQSLYSLWMVPDEVAGFSQDAADRLNSVLGRLCALLANKVAQLSRKGRVGNLYHPQRESCDNLSRLTLNLSQSQLRLPGSHLLIGQSSNVLSEPLVEEDEVISQEVGENEEERQLSVKIDDAANLDESQLSVPGSQPLIEQSSNVLPEPFAEEEEDNSQAVGEMEEGRQLSVNIDDIANQEEAGKESAAHLDEGQTLEKESISLSSAKSTTMLPNSSHHEIISDQSKSYSIDKVRHQTDGKESGNRQKRKKQRRRHKRRHELAQNKNLGFQRDKVRKYYVRRKLRKPKEYTLMDALRAFMMKVFCLT